MRASSEATAAWLPPRVAEVSGVRGSPRGTIDRYVQLSYRLPDIKCRERHEWITVTPRRPSVLAPIASCRTRGRTASPLGPEGVVMRVRVSRSFKLALGIRTRPGVKSTSVILGS
jgi:hypothetical protein